MLARRPPVALATALALSVLGQLVQATPSGFSFGDSCVNSRVKDSPCGSDPKCMCKGAKVDFMETILGCMVWFCGNELQNADGVFLGSSRKLECSSIGRTIPQKNIQAAEKLASSLVSKLDSTATRAATTTAHSPAKTTLRRRRRRQPRHQQVTPQRLPNPHRLRINPQRRLQPARVRAPSALHLLQQPPGARLDRYAR